MADLSEYATAFRASNGHGGNLPMMPARTGSEEGFGSAFSHKAPTLATDMRCYFGCKETFKKDYDIHLHLKIKHRNEDQNELKRAYQDAEEEIALTRKSYSKFQCALCPKQMDESGAFSGHIRKVHKVQWMDYKNKYGRCEVESAPFECKICGRVVKYGSHTVHVHLKNCHNITWVQYLDRIRKMRQGQAAEELPALEFFECKVCTAQVKFMFRGKHLKGVHKITEAEYVELFKEELKNQLTNTPIQRIMPNRNLGSDEKPSGVFSPYSMDNQDMPPRFSPAKQDVKQSGGFSQYPMENQDMQPQLSHRDASTEEYGQNQRFNSPPVQLPDQPMMPYPTKPPMNNAPIKPPKSDIQDKTNKKCSSCMMTFDSRRNFIDHCTSFHNMKFRTASGATISGSISSPSNPGYQQGIKRQIDDNNGRVSPGSRYSNQMPVHQSTKGYQRNGASFESRVGGPREDGEEGQYNAPNMQRTMNPHSAQPKYLKNEDGEVDNQLPLY